MPEPDGFRNKFRELRKTAERLRAVYVAFRGSGQKKESAMKRLLLAASVAALALGGIASTPASADEVSIGVTVGPHHHHHYWWHGRWYDDRPYGYYYVAPPYPYEHPYWRAHWRTYHHCRDYDHDGDCH
jgi:hypothetical protein